VQFRQETTWQYYWLTDEYKLIQKTYKNTCQVRAPNWCHLGKIECWHIKGCLFEIPNAVTSCSVGCSPKSWISDSGENASVCSMFMWYDSIWYDSWYDLILIWDMIWYDMIWYDMMICYMWHVMFLQRKLTVWFDPEVNEFWWTEYACRQLRSRKATCYVDPSPI
jgi:hypothetical protein